ncbi:glycosyltransferase [Flavobacteriaceae bacterium S356]|uniref:Glycosyltransferase n=1 Tax=Asprobacillus argus TaxID=3076534 RepID=A0ABU3LDZ2_9FLAO|nr:glycosyltransferase [Flavobacteriaceae bacterium S356]
MKILFVCQQYIHSARWINQLKDSGHEIFVFDALDKPIHETLKWTHFFTDWSKRKVKPIRGEYTVYKKFPGIYDYISPLLKVTASEKLIEVINEIQPDLVHSLEMQSQSYHLLKAKKKIDFKWAYSSWGSDLFLYKDHPYHAKKIKRVLNRIDYAYVDNSRDEDYLKKLDLSMKVMPILPGGGGYPIETYRHYMQPVSKRKLILIKGYDHWAGRALKILSAVESIVDQLRTYPIYVYSAHDKVIDRIAYLNRKFNLQIEYSSRFDQISQEELLQKFGNAKVSIGNSISDGIPNTLLEAMLLGAFPIQSNPGGVTEDYIENGVNGLLIDNPENIEEIAEIILLALKNEELIKKAFETNQEKVKVLEYTDIQKKVLETYTKIEKDVG